jgi:acetoacetyl-CoA reductase
MVTQFQPDLQTRSGRFLEGRVAVVTGGARGIGAAITAELASHGASLVVNYAHSANEAYALVEALKAQETPAIAVLGDVSVPEEAERIITAASEAFGKVDILVNNAGINRDKTLKNLELHAWQEVLRTNLDSAYFCTRAALPHMLKNGWGRVINISSIIGQSGGFGQANYAASKGGMIAFTKSVALEVARFGITVNAVCPGFIETDMLQGVPERARETLLGRIPLGRFGHPDEVASLVRFLCAEAAWVTGQEFNINGGQYM